MKDHGKLLALVVLTALVLAVVAPLALGAKATPSVSLSVKPATIKVGEKVRFSGLVRHAVPKDTTVKLWQVSGKKATLEKSGAISGTGAYWFTAKGVKAGSCSFRVTYRAGKTTYTSNTVKVTITK